MTALTKSLNFLKDLSKNNSRDWFNANKTRFEEARDIVQEFCATLIKDIKKFDPGINDPERDLYMFRIYKDVRFSKDKSPYKTSFGVTLTAGGNKFGHGGYYLHLAPNGESMIAGGVHMPTPDDLDKLRAHIANHHQDFEKIVQAKPFRDTFGNLMDMEDKLKKVPRGFAADHPAAEWLKYKSYVAGRKFEDREVIGDGFARDCIATFKTLKPLNDFLKNA